MSANRFVGSVVVMTVFLATASSARPQEALGDGAAIQQFQRSVDSYAFQHRQIQRRLGESVDANAMALGLRAARPAAAEGDFFTPIVAAAFRHRLAVGLKAPACKSAAATLTFEVPRVGAGANGTHSLPGCLVEVLPRLPEELEYRMASAALILVDTHANLVVDVVHAAFPMQGED